MTPLLFWLYAQVFIGESLKVFWCKCAGEVLFSHKCLTSNPAQYTKELRKR